MEADAIEPDVRDVELEAEVDGCRFRAANRGVEECGAVADILSTVRLRAF